MRTMMDSQCDLR